MLWLALVLRPGTPSPSGSIVIDATATGYARLPTGTVAAVIGHAEPPGHGPRPGRRSPSGARPAAPPGRTLDRPMSGRTRQKAPASGAHRPAGSAAPSAALTSPTPARQHAVGLHLAPQPVRPGVVTPDPTPELPHLRRPAGPWLHRLRPPRRPGAGDRTSQAPGHPGHPAERCGRPARPPHRARDGPRAAPPRQPRRPADPAATHRRSPDRRGPRAAGVVPVRKRRHRRQGAPRQLRPTSRSPSRSATPPPVRPTTRWSRSTPSWTRNPRGSGDAPGAGASGLPDPAGAARGGRPGPG